jgi:hypothetical protein
MLAIVSVNGHPIGPTLLLGLVFEGMIKLYATSKVSAAGLADGPMATSRGG